MLLLRYHVCMVMVVYAYRIWRHMHRYTAHICALFSGVCQYSCKLWELCTESWQDNREISRKRGCYLQLRNYNHHCQWFGLVIDAAITEAYYIVAVQCVPQRSMHIFVEVP